MYVPKGMNERDRTKSVQLLFSRKLMLFNSNVHRINPQIKYPLIRISKNTSTRNDLFDRKKKEEMNCYLISRSIFSKISGRRRIRRAGVVANLFFLISLINESNFPMETAVDSSRDFIELNKDFVGANGFFRS